MKILGAFIIFLEKLYYKCSPYIFSNIVKSWQFYERKYIIESYKFCKN